MGIVVVVDGLTGVPHVVGWHVRATHDRRQKALIHKHLKGANIGYIGADPAQQKHHTKENSFADDDIREIGPYDVDERLACPQKACNVTEHNDQQYAEYEELAKGQCMETH